MIVKLKYITGGHYANREALNVAVTKHYYKQLTGYLDLDEVFFVGDVYTLDDDISYFEISFKHNQPPMYLDGNLHAAFLRLYLKSRDGHKWIYQVQGYQQDSQPIYEFFNHNTEIQELK